MSEPVTVIEGKKIQYTIQNWIVLDWISAIVDPVPENLKKLMAASRASWFSLSLYGREGSRSEFGIAKYSVEISA